MRLSVKGVVNIRRGLKRSWQPGGAHDARFRHRPVDADTLRHRALEDRRGSLYAKVEMEGQTFGLHWSTNGRSDQLDIFHAGKIVATCRRSLVWDKLAEMLR